MLTFLLSIFRILTLFRTLVSPIQNHLTVGIHTVFRLILFWIKLPVCQLVFLLYRGFNTEVQIFYENFAGELRLNQRHLKLLELFSFSL